MHFVPLPIHSKKDTMTLNNIKVIAFDADDTLWANQNYFEEAGEAYADLLAPYMPPEELATTLLKVEQENSEIYGFGAKSFTLSMIETALLVSNNEVEQIKLQKMLQIGKYLLNMPIIQLTDVESVLQQVQDKHKYQLVVATKGDLTDQERKLERSGLKQYFDHIEIMSNKMTTDYTHLLDKLDCRPEEFLMVGNSLKSDIIPVIEMGGYAAHIPYHLTWANEIVTDKFTSERCFELTTLKGLLKYLPK